MKYKHEEWEFNYRENYLPKGELVHGEYYKGRCRNAIVARWNAEENVFYHFRTKWNRTFVETIRHPEDDDGFDLFYPHRVAGVGTYADIDREIPFEDGQGYHIYRMKQ